MQETISFFLSFGVLYNKKVLLVHKVCYKSADFLLWRCMYWISKQ